MKRKLIHELNPFYKIRIDILNAEVINETQFLKSLEEKLEFHRSANYSIMEVSLCDIKPLTKYVYNFRLDKANELLKKYSEKNISPFKPIFLNYMNEYCQLVSPPILELHNDKLVLCDGTHRVYEALIIGLEKIFCLLIKNVSNSLPGDINEWQNVKVLNEEVPVNENFINYRPENLTGYTWIFNNEKTWFEKTKTTKEILDDFAKPKI